MIIKLFAICWKWRNFNYSHDKKSGEKMINISSILFFLSFRDGISHVIIMHLRLFTGFLPVWANCILTVLHRSVCQSQPVEWVSFARYLQPAILIQVTYFSLSDIWVWWWPVKLNQSCRAHNVDNKVSKWTLKPLELFSIALCISPCHSFHTDSMCWSTVLRYLKCQTSTCSAVQIV